MEGISTMNGRVNLFDYWAEDGPAGATGNLQLVRFDANELVVVPFTSEGAQVKLHYCEQPEIQGYVQCNGPGCVLCRAGRKAEERVLLPVYLPAAQSMGVMAISPSSHPGALRPQIMPVLRSGKRVALLIRKADRMTFQVGTVELGEGMDDGARLVKGFQKRWEAGEIDLASVYARLENRDLAGIPGIAAMLRLKGVTLDGND
jgi:hypothetical protein